MAVIKYIREEEWNDNSKQRTATRVLRLCERWHELVITRIDRICRNVLDLEIIVKELTNKEFAVCN